MSSNEAYRGGFDTDTSPILDKKVSRRGLLTGAVGIGATAVTIGCGFALSRSSGEKSPSQDDAPAPESDRSVSPSEALKRIDAFVLPDFYEDRPWANPKNFVGKSADEIKSMSTVIIENSIPTAEDLENIRRVLEAMANVGGDPDDMRAAREAGYPVGDWDGSGPDQGCYPQYIETRVESMLEGLFEDNSTITNDKLSEYFAQYAEGYERALYRDDWRNSATVFVDANLTSSEVGRLTANLTIGRPVKSGDWREARNVHKGEMTIVVHKDSAGNSELAMERHNIGPVEE